FAGDFDDLGAVEDDAVVWFAADAEGGSDARGPVAGVHVLEIGGKLHERPAVEGDGDAALSDRHDSAIPAAVFQAAAHDDARGVSVVPRAHAANAADAEDSAVARAHHEVEVSPVGRADLADAGFAFDAGELDDVVVLFGRDVAERELRVPVVGGDGDAGAGALALAVHDVAVEIGAGEEVDLVGRPADRFLDRLQAFGDVRFAQAAEGGQGRGVPVAGAGLVELAVAAAALFGGVEPGVAHGELRLRVECAGRLLLAAAEI